MHMFHILEFTIQNRNVHLSVLNGASWDMGQMLSIHFSSDLYGVYMVIYVFLSYAYSIEPSYASKHLYTSVVTTG